MKRLARTPFSFKGLSMLLVAALLAAVLLPAGYAALTPTPVLAAASAPHEPTVAKWYDGSIQYSTITNCVSIIQGFPYFENGIGTYVGFLADPDNARPAPNMPYYMHVVVAGMGNACSGMRAYIDIGLPASTSLAIDGTNKVKCFYDGVALPAADCTQTLTASTYNSGMLNIRSSDAAHAYLWPIPLGRILEIQIPVVSSTTLTNSALSARVWALDGNSSPWLQPQQGVYVFSSQPAILYPSPSTTLITATSARSEAYLYTFGLGGTGYFDIGTTTAYGFTEPVIIPAGGNAFSAWDNWGPLPVLLPDTIYHWRFRFTPTSGSPVIGANQTFRTLPDGRITVGNGSTASCTPAALTGALATAKEIIFNCGALPTTITLSGTQTVTAANLLINGGNKVTLNMAGTANHFNVQGGAHLTLTQIELANGSGACGSVHVLGNARLTLNAVRFNSNTGGNGGAVCIDALGQAVATDSLFINNYANLGGGVYNEGTLTINRSAFTTNLANSFGGAIVNYGTATINDTFFTQNRAYTNGGAIDSTVNLTVARSTFTGNQAGVRGGAINNYLGTMTVRDSRFINNHSGGYGGAIANDAGNATVFSSELSGNSANSVGGGVRNSGTFSITNSTLANNSAVTGGGGFENAGTLALLNVTLAGNTSPGTGGNLYLGASASSSVTLKNTLVAAGRPNNCDKAITSLGNNLESANTCGLGAAGDRLNTNPRINTLQYGRSTMLNIPLLPGSPAIDAASNTGCPATDQRGFGRPLDGDKNGSFVCDIGAFEYNPTLDLPKIYLPTLRR